MFQRNQLLIWLQWASGNETKKMEFEKIHRGVFFSCNTFLLVEDDVIEIANFLWVLMVNDRYVCGIVVSWENLSGVVSLCGWMLIGCLFIDGTTALMLDVVIETALTMVAVVLPLTGIDRFWRGDLLIQIARFVHIKIIKNVSNHLFGYSFVDRLRNSLDCGGKRHSDQHYQDEETTGFHSEMLYWVL